jgi:glycosyltransferase involved in cell wall biosynthesis
VNVETQRRPQSFAIPPRQGTALLVANFAPDVGFAWWLMESFWIQLAEMARQHGLRPLLVYPAAGEVPDSITAAEIPVEIVPFPGRGLIGLMKSLRLVRKRGVKVVYLTDRPFTSLKYLLLRVCGVRLIINHDHAPGDRRIARGFRGVVKSVWRRVRPIGCDLQLCVSPLIQERAVLSGRIPRRRTAVVQNGIRPLECEGDPDHVRKELGIPQGAAVCITASRADAYKRVDFVIEVARRCVVELGIRDLYFVHCGDGPDLPRLKDLHRSSGLGERFILAGRRTDVPDLLCSADYALHPSKGEAFSLAILEYMSAALAVLVPDIPTVSQAIRHGETGLVFPDGDASTAAAMLADLHANPSRAKRLGAAAASEVKERYSWGQMHDAFRDSVMRLLSDDRIG